MGYPIGDTARLLAEVEHKYHEWEKRQMLDEKFAALDARWKKARYIRMQRENIRDCIEGLRSLASSAEGGFVEIRGIDLKFGVELRVPPIADVLIDRLAVEDERLAKELEAIL